jgi:hypothetical protein
VRLLPCCGHARTCSLPLRRNLIVIVAHLPNIGNFGIVGLAQQPRETRSIEQRILASVHGHHAES